MRNKNTAFPLRLVTIIILFSVCIGISGFIFYDSQAEQIKKAKIAELQAIAELRKKQIVQWRADHLKDANVVMNAANIGFTVDQGSQAGSGNSLAAFMESIYDMDEFYSVSFHDVEGNLRFTIKEDREGLDPASLSLFAEAVRSQKPVLSDVQKTNDTPKVYMDLVIPVTASAGPPPNKRRPTGAPNTTLESRGTRKTLGVFLFRINPGQRLYPLLSSWPTPSETGESFLVEQDGKTVTYLSHLRHVANIPVSFRLPAESKALPAALAVSGVEGVVEGTDYRDVPVLAALKKIPDSRWSLVAKMDMSEIYAPLRVFFLFTTMVVGLLVVATGISIGLSWKIENAAFYRRQYETELERKALIQHYDYLTKYANDIILLTEGEGTIIDANERALQVYGFTRDEFTGTNFYSLVDRNATSDLEAKRKTLESTGSLIYEAVHRKKDGSSFFVEVSSRIIEIEGKRFYQAIIRDITNRKKYEADLRKSYEDLRLMTEGIIETLAQTTEKRDPYTADHQRRVAKIAVAIAEELGLAAHQKEGIHVAGLLHDIGKIGVPSEILSRPGKPSEYEFKIIQTHPQVGYDILKDINFSWPVAKAVLQHHERMNGAGYPLGLKGPDIIMEAKILSVADVVESIASHRPYRPALGLDFALKEIAANTGTLYDTDVAKACIRLFREKGFHLDGIK